MFDGLNDSLVIPCRGAWSAGDTRRIHTRIHTGPFEALLAPWASLYAEQPAASPFMSPGWARSWLTSFAVGSTPFCVVVEDGPAVVGLAPLVIRRRGPFRLLEPVGMEPGDHWSPLTAPGHREEVHAWVARALAGAAGDWDAWLLRTTDGPTAAALSQAGLRWCEGTPVPAPAVALPETFDAYLSTLSKSRRSNLRRHLKRLDQGEVTLRAVAPDRLGPALGRWQELRRRQWDQAGDDIDPEHLSPRFAAFVEHVAAALIPRGEAEVLELVVGGQVVGAYVNFMNAAAYHWYLGGYDPEHRSLGLGKIAIAHGIRSSIERGRGTYDFGRGGEAYKYWYGAQDRWQSVRLVGNGKTRSRLALRAGRRKMTRTS